MRTSFFKALVGLLVVLSGGCSSREESLTIAFSNDMVGEIRSCGCVQKDFGGLGRRATFVRNVRKRATNVALFDGGDFFGVGVNYGKEKASLTLQAMAVMGYDGVVVGEKELAFGKDYLVERVKALRLPVVACNLYDEAADTLLFPPSRTVELDSGLRLGVVGVIGDGLKLPDAGGEGVRIAPFVPALQREVAALKPRVDLVVVLAHMRLKEAQRLAERHADVDLVVCGHDGRPMRKVRRFGNAYVMETTTRGRYMGVAHATVDRKRGVTDLIVSQEPLSRDYDDDEAIVKLFRVYDMEIASVERRRVMKAVSNGTHVKSRFAGSEKCGACHEDINVHWERTKHAHAFAVLKNQNRELDRDCVPCHTTGFYEIGGFLSVVETPDLIHVQCEACHGNGTAHSRNPEIKTPGRSRRACVACHTRDQSPDFNFGEYWAKIQHPKDGSSEGSGR